MAQATQLNATEQDTLVKQIGLSLLRAAPRDWQRVTAEYRAVGRFHELTGEIVLSDGSTVDWVATHDIATLFGRLRAGMYREGRGTWFNARYQLDHPSSYNLEYDREEPQWDIKPPPQAYADELRTFPRSEDNIPEWLMRRMSGLGPERPGPRFRIARIFDGAGPGGRPVLNRPELEIDEQDRLLEYLDNAPVVVPSRGYDIDRLATTPEGTVPVAFHSDGVWIWPAAVNYYLREYGVAPEPELIQHIHASGFAVPAVPDQVRQAAAAHINRGAPPPRQGPPPVAPAQSDGTGDRPAARTAEEPPVQPQRDQRPPDLSSGQHESVYEEAPDQTTYAAPVIGEREFSTQAPAEPAHDNTQYHEPQYHETQYHEPQYHEPRFDDHDDEGDDEADYDRDHRDFGGTGVEQEHADQDMSAHRARVDPPTTFTPAADMDAGPMTTITPAVGAPVAAASRYAAGATEPRAADQRVEPQRQEQQRQDLPQSGARRFEPSHVPDRNLADDEPVHRSREFDDIGPPTQAGGVPLPEHAEPVLDKLQDTLRELSVPDSAYRIGMPAEYGWSVEEVASGWRVGWYEGELTNPAMFGDAEDAAAFMLGKLLLAPDGGVSGTQPPPAAAAPTPQPPPPPAAGRQSPLTTTLSPEIATGASAQRGPEPAPAPARPTGPPPPETREHPEQPAVRPSVTPGANGAGAPVPTPPPLVPTTPAAPARPAAAGGGGTGAGQQWPIQPMDGEPPLTLFRGKEVRELPAGSELDRFGGPNGNLTYAAGTPFEERSLVPEWVNRPYHVYRVQRPLEALAGVSIPWFNQPGGGAAYLLPTSIEELVAEGDLIELEPGEPPVY